MKVANHEEFASCSETTLISPSAASLHYYLLLLSQFSAQTQHSLNGTRVRGRRRQDPARGQLRVSLAKQQLSTARRAIFGVWCEYNGVGQKCSWDVSYLDWTGGTITCSWASYGAVRSIRNNGRYQDVKYFTGRNYSGSSGISVKGSRGNLPRGYILLSHYWYG